MDCDMLVLDDIANLWDLRNDKFDVMCVKHNHTPKETKKFLNQPQTQYEKKNWSSVMLFNSQKCKVLTPKYVNEETGLNLHRFNWVGDDTLIGALPPRWNHLVDYDPKFPEEKLSNLHFTTGGPYFEEFKNCGYSDLWFKYRAILGAIVQVLRNTWTIGPGIAQCLDHKTKYCAIPGP